MRALISLIKMVFYLIATLMIVVTQWPFLRLHKGPSSYILPRLYHRACCKITGIKVYVQGKPVMDKQTFFVSNHVSYMDIPAIGSILKGSFVGKNDMLSWPVYGFLGSLQQTAYISRSSKDAVKEKNSLFGMLKEGKSLILFPEGTSTEGKTVLPFKSSLFTLPLDPALKDTLIIQPMTVRLLKVDGQEVTEDRQDLRDLYAWYGEMELVPHMKDFFLTKGAEIALIFHPPINVAEYEDRKILSKTCHEIVESGLTEPLEPGTTKGANTMALAA